jgi:signal transduction histidine kinase
MKKIGCKIVFVIFSLFLTVPQRSFSADNVKTIVVFFSLNESVPAYQSILEGFHTSFPKYFNEPYNLLIEYLDVQRSSDEAYLKHIVSLYNEKFDAERLDLIITVGPGSYELLRKNGLKVLNNTPTITIELDQFFGDKPTKPVPENIFQINLKFNFERTIKNTIDLFPDHKNIYIISGSSVADKYFANLTRQATLAFGPKYNFKFITDISLDSTLQIVRKIPENSIVFIPSYMSDVNHAPISTTFALNHISAQCIAPLFPSSDNFIKHGGIGGYIFSFNSVGKEAGRLSGEILNGKPIKELILHQTDFFQYRYDWKELKRWNLLDSKAIPSESTFINKEPDFYTEYRWRIIGALLFLIAQTYLILYLIKLNRRQKEIVKQKDQLESLHRELIHEDRLSKMAELTASLSHELNQPLTAILYNAQAGMRFMNSGKLDASQAEQIFENIIEDNKRASGIISGIRSLMKPESKEMEVVNLNLLIEETFKLFSPEAARHKVKISLLVEESPVLVLGNKIQLQQVILNFLSNAVQSLELIEPPMRKLKITELRNTELVTVSVKDTGPGINPEILNKIFKPFVSTRKDGFGIGLSISKSIIEKHNGKIWAENVVGGGAKFCFNLKVVNHEQ